MARVPRVLYLLDDLGGGGAQRQAVETAAWLMNQGEVSASFLTYYGDGFFAPRLEKCGIPQRCVPKRGRLDPLFPKRLAAALADEKPDLVHAFMRGPSFWASRALGRWPKSSRPALVASERNSFFAQGRRQAFMQGLAFRRANVITANAASVAEEIPKRFGVDAAKVHYIPNGIDLSSWDEALEKTTPLSFSADAFHIGLVGRLVPQKNHRLLLRALARLDPKTRETWKVWFVGATGGAHGCEGEVKKEVATLGLRDVVQLVEPQTEVAPIMKALDVFVLPSDYEGFPNVVLEAMASRTAIVATDVGDVQNLVGSDEGGLVVPRGDEAALAEALHGLFDLGPQGRQMIGEAGRARVEARFQIESVAKQYLALYRGALRS